MKKALLVMAVVSTAAFATYKLTRSDTSRDSGVVKADASLTQDRIWIDHLPRNDRDTFQIFLALTEEPVGIFQAASQWAGQYEIFRYEMNGSEIRFVFPQNGDREKATANARECRDHGHDYCLDLSGTKRGVKKYYSRKGWEIDGLTTEQAKAKADQIIESLQTEK